MVRDQAESSNAYLNSLGALHFRAGHWKKAEQLLQQSRKEQRRARENQLARDAAVESRISKIPPRIGPDAAAPNDDAGTIWDWLFLAMTYHELNDMSAAEKWLNLAKERFESEAGESWTRRAELEILLKEAEQKIGS